MYEIFKAKVPSRTHTVRSKYPFPQMKPGHAFNVPADDWNAKRNSSGGCTIASAAHGYSTRHGGKFVTRRNTDDSITVYRVE